MRMLLRCTPILIFMGFLMSGCIQDAKLTVASSSDSSGSSSTSSGTSSYTLVVAPLFSAAPNWNDYVRAASTTTACDGTESSATACIHGGELRKVVTGETSCTGLSMTDTLNAFFWNCSIESGYATFTSFFRWDNGLRNLVNASGWIPNGVTLTGGTAFTYTNTASVWWSNPVTIINSNISPSVTYSTTGGIYVITSSIYNDGINLNAHKIALVTLADNVLMWPNSLTNNFNSSTGEVAAVNSTAHVSAGSQNFLWIEIGALSTTTNKAADGIALLSCKFSRIHRTGLIGHTFGGIYTNDSHYNLFTGNTLVQNSRGLYISNSNSNRFFMNKTTNSNAFDGVYLWVSHGNTFVDTLSASNADTGFGVHNSYNNNIVASTVVNNQNNAVYLSSSSVTHIHLEAAINNNFTLSHTAAHYSTFSQIAGTNHDGYGTTYSSSNNSKYTGNLLAHASPSCTGGATFGIFGNCTAEGSSNHNLVAVSTLAPDFIGQVTSDAVNTSDTAGTATFSLSSMDWFSFANSMRAWGKNFSFPTTAVKSACSTGTCKIYDYSLSSTGSIIFNRTGDGATPNSAPSPGACPSEVNGNVTLTNVGRCSLPQYDSPSNCTSNSGTWDISTYLKSAYEIMNDFTGDDDGLCEANELCIYAPNFGAYQGHGPLLQCAYNQSGGLAGVKMHYYQSNGI